MTASEYDFSQTRSNILQRALRIVGALSLGETMTADQEEQGSSILNSVVKSWQAKGTFLWQVVDVTIAMVAGTGSYAMPTDPPLLTIDQAFLRLLSTTTDSPLARLSFEQFKAIASKTEQGTPTVFTCNDGYLSVWPIPLTSSTWSVIGTGVARLKDWDTAGGTGEFPAHWLEALVYSVADGLAPEYGLPVREWQALTMRAIAAFNDAKKLKMDVSDYSYTRGAFG